MSAKEEILDHDNLMYRAFDGSDWNWPSRPSLEFLSAVGKGSFWNPGQGLLLQWTEQDDPDPVFFHWTSVDGLEIDLRMIDFDLSDARTLLRENDYAGMGAEDIDWSWTDDAMVGAEALEMDLSDIQHSLWNLDGWLYCAPDIVGGEPLERALARVGLKLAPAPSVGDRVSALDMALVSKIARNELELMAGDDWGEGTLPVPRTACTDLAKSVLEGYLGLPDVVGPIADRALRAADMGPASSASLGPSIPTDEFVAGHALAVAARNHAARALDTGLAQFASRALDPGLHRDLDLIGPVDGDRAVGVSMERGIRSAQTCAPRTIALRAERYDIGDGWTAADVLTPADCEDIARGLMESFGGLDLDYADLEDVDDRIRQKLAEKAERTALDIRIPCIENAERSDDDGAL